MELKAPETGPAAATVVEASLARSGPTATVIVRRGQLRVGDVVVVGTEWGTVSWGFCTIQFTHVPHGPVQ